MKRSTERILTTHVGSLPRPHDLLNAMRARLSGQPYDEQAYALRVQQAVADSVRRQVQAGIDTIADGEQSKRGFFPYVTERLAGFEPRPSASFPLFGKKVAHFPDYYKQYFVQAMLGGAVSPVVPMACIGPYATSARMRSKQTSPI